MQRIITGRQRFMAGEEHRRIWVGPDDHRTIAQGQMPIRKFTSGGAMLEIDRFAFMEAARIQLARQILDMLTHGEPVPSHDALQLRNWAAHADDAMLSLEEIAYRILTEEDNSSAKAAEP